MLMPKRVKYRRQHRGRMKGISKAGNEISGEYGLQALEPAWITSQQIEAARIAMTRFIKRGGKVWIRIFLISRSLKSRLKPEWARKGSPRCWVAVVKPGRIMFELGGVDEEDIAREALRLGSHKLPIKTKIVVREESGGVSE